MKLNLRKVSQEDKEDVVQTMVEHGFTFLQIGKETGMGESTIKNIAKKLNLTDPAKAPDYEPPKEKMKYPMVRINEGKECYADYVKAEAERQLNAMINKLTTRR